MKQKLTLRISAICLLSSSVIKAQVTVPTNNAPAGTQYVGWSGVPAVNTKALDVKNFYANQNINFFTNGTGANGTSVQRLTLLGNAGPTAGFVGIGSIGNALNPLFQLDVNDNTNLNITYLTNPGFGYRINGIKLLSNPGQANTFVGENSGTAWLSPTNYTYCTFVGANAGPVNQADANTFIGESAGLANTTGAFNTFLGAQCGEKNTTGKNNTFVGHHAGLNNTTGSDNVFIGYHSVGLTSGVCTGSFNTSAGSGVIGSLTTGSNNCMFGFVAGSGLSSGSDNSVYGRSAGQFMQTGSSNSFYGMNSGFGTSTGNGNVFMGRNAGAFNQTGSNNVIIGNLANMLAGQTNLSNAMAIGFQAVVSDNNKMILGNNNINVGIGLSSSAVGNGPQKKLEINETAVATALVANTTIPGTFGGSGLRFRKLTAATPTASPNGKVLTVNANGDVILVPDVASSVAPGAIVAQNGLTLLGTNTVEWGGTLLHNTNIDFAGKEILYYDGLSNLHYQRAASGARWQHALGVNPKDNQACFSDYAVINSGAPVGYQLHVYPISSSVAGSGLHAHRLRASGTPTTGGPGINADIFGYYSSTDNLTSTSDNNYSNASWAQGASSAATAINAAYFARAERTTGITSNNIGFYAYMSNGAYQATKDIGVYADVASNANTTETYGGYFKASYGKNVYGIYAEANPGSGTSYAGYFKGDVYVNGGANSGTGYLMASDQTLKMNIDTISNVQTIIKQLKPKTFYFDTTNASGIKFSSKRQYGFIAQDVELILPELVGNVTKPEERDSLGNISIPAITYKNLNYNSFIALLIRNSQIQQRQNEKQDSIIQVMQSQISSLTSSVTSCCSSSAVRTTSEAEQNQLAVT